jgi:hypothetical protein
MRNVMAHQIYSAATHNIAFDYRLNVGWDRIGNDLHVTPRVFGDQFIAALDGGKLSKWRTWTTPDLLLRQKWRFIADWLELKPKEPLRIASVPNEAECLVFSRSRELGLSNLSALQTFECFMDGMSG